MEKQYTEQDMLNWGGYYYKTETKHPELTMMDIWKDWKDEKTAPKTPVIISKLDANFGYVYVKFLTCDGNATIIKSFTCDKEQVKKMLEDYIEQNNFEVK